ncbi:MAG TPA: Maf family protein [Xanthobacteraceae bacterium]|jgi:septum formation protein
MPLWLAEQPLMLASRSEIRLALLRNAGLPVEARAPDIDERSIERRAGKTGPGEVAALLAREKARTIAGRHPARLVLGADQTLTLEDRRFSKPIDRAAAREQLGVLRGRTHELHTALALARDGKTVWEHREAARLTMREFSDAFLEAYLDRAGPAVTRSVGGYQLEGLGIQLLEHVDGDHFVILGLPLLALMSYLRQSGLLAR